MQQENNENDRTETCVVFTKGFRVGRYTIVKKIGFGGMGEVYLAEDKELNRRVALKFMPPHLSRDEECRKRFKREARAAAQLNHPNIITIYEVAEFQERPFIAMEHIEGRSLSDIIRKKELKLSEVLELAVQICEGMYKAHRSGVIHRDIKPSNIMVDNDGRVKILDFGLASIKDEQKITRDGTLLGTSGYMSPEQILGEKVDERSDIFALGIVFYELITGRQPFKKDSESATYRAILEEKPEPLRRFKADVPEALQHMVAKALEKNPALRYQHSDECRSDLKRLQVKLESHPGSVRRGEYHREWRLYHKRISIMGMVMVIALALLLTLSSTTRQTFLRWLHLDKVPIEKHLAVLPFTCLGEVFASQTFCDGLMETLTSRLTQMEKFQGALWVVPAREVLEREVFSVKDARKAFGVTLAVTGSVQELGGDIRLALNLIDTRSERQIHSVLIDVPFNELVVLQDSTVMSMAEMLEIHLLPEQEQYLNAGRTDIPEAFGLYLAGRGYLQQYEKSASVDTAIIKFHAALEYDPRYALAYAALGEAYWRKFQATNEPEWIDQARGNSQVALSLDDQLAPVNITLGMIYRGTGEYEKAIREYNLARVHEPSNYEAYRGLATTYEALNLFDEAVAHYRKMIALRPKYWAGYFDLGLFYTYRGDIDKAVALLHQAARLVPYNARDYNDIGALYGLLDFKDEARRMWQQSVEIEPNYAAYSNLGYLYHKQRDYKEAAHMYEQALDISDHDHNVWSNLASVYHWIPGMKEKSVEANRRAIVEAEKQLGVNPHDPKLMVSLAQYYAMVADTVKARDMVDEALRLGADNTEIVVSALFVFEKLNDRPASVYWIKKALQLGYTPENLASFPEFEDLLADEQVKKAIEEIKNNGADNSSRSY